MDLEKMRSQAAEVVAREDIRVLIGWKEGTFGYRVAPAFAVDTASAAELTFSPLCTANLATYLTLAERVPLPRGEEEDKRKTALMVKGCDSRAVAQLLVEKGLERDDVYVLGCSCPGMIDEKSLARDYPEGEERASLTWGENGDFLLQQRGEKVVLLRDKYLAEKCRLCRYPNAVVSDLDLFDPVGVPETAEDTAVLQLEKQPVAERWAYWQEQFKACLRCYSCRNVCPLCYCRDCILDRLNPTWVNRSVNFSENTAFNLARAFHLAGRCIECGECERVCPAGLPLGRINRKMAQEVREKYGFEPGLDPGGEAFQAAYKPDDPGDFIL